MNPSPENFDPTKSMIDKVYQPERMIDKAFEDSEPQKIPHENEALYRGEINNAEISNECKLRATKLKELLSSKEEVNRLLQRLNAISLMQKGRFLRSVVAFLNCTTAILEEGENTTGSLYEITLRNLDVLNEELKESSIAPIEI